MYVHVVRLVQYNGYNNYKINFSFFFLSLFVIFFALLFFFFIRFWLLRHTQKQTYLVEQNFQIAYKLWQLVIIIKNLTRVYDEDKIMETNATNKKQKGIALILFAFLVGFYLQKFFGFVKIFKSIQLTKTNKISANKFIYDHHKIAGPKIKVHKSILSFRFWKIKTQLIYIKYLRCQIPR